MAIKAKGLLRAHWEAKAEVEAARRAVPDVPRCRVYCRGTGADIAIIIDSDERGEPIVGINGLIFDHQEALTIGRFLVDQLEDR